MLCPIYPDQSWKQNNLILRNGYSDSFDRTSIEIDVIQCNGMNGKVTCASVPVIEKLLS